MRLGVGLEVFDLSIKYAIISFIVYYICFMTGVLKEEVNGGEAVDASLQLCEVEKILAKLVGLLEVNGSVDILCAELAEVYVKMWELWKCNIGEVDLPKLNVLLDKLDVVVDMLAVLVMVRVGVNGVLTDDQIKSLPIGSLDLGPREMALVLLRYCLRKDPVFLEQYLLQFKKWISEVEESINEIQLPASKAVAESWLMVVKVKIIMFGKCGAFRESLNSINIVIDKLKRDIEEDKITLSTEDELFLERLMVEIRVVELCGGVD